MVQKNRPTGKRASFSAEFPQEVEVFAQIGPQNAVVRYLAKPSVGALLGYDETFAYIFDFIFTVGARHVRIGDIVYKLDDNSDVVDTVGGDGLEIQRRFLYKKTD